MDAEQAAVILQELAALRGRVAALEAEVHAHRTADGSAAVGLAAAGTTGNAGAPGAAGASQTSTADTKNQDPNHIAPGK